MSRNSRTYRISLCASTLFVLLAGFSGVRHETAGAQESAVGDVTAASPAAAKGTGAGSAKPPQSASPSIDDQLLRDLPLDLPKPGSPNVKPTDKPAADAQGKPVGAQDPAKPTTVPSTDEGEDIQLVGPDEFLRDIRRRMKQVEQRLRDRDLSRSTQAEQEKIAAELASFIRQLQRQQSQGKGPKSKQGGSGVASDQTGGAQQATKGAAVESAERNTDSTRTGDGPASLEASLPGVWGNLSPQLRQQIQSLTSDKFLPQYERLIQQYYRRLAETTGS